MQAIENVLQYESRYLSMLKDRLQRIGVVSEGNPALEPVYAALRLSYDQACEQMHRLTSDLQRCIDAAHQAQSDVPILARRSNAVSKVMALGRCTQERPSETFRRLMRAEAKPIVSSLQAALLAEDASDADVEEFIDRMGMLLCDFELPDAKVEQKSIWPDIFKVGGGIVAGWFGNDIIRNNTNFLGKPDGQG